MAPAFPTVKDASISLFTGFLKNRNDPKMLFLPGISHLEWQGHNYFLSWREPWHKFEDWDWFNGRNFCRDRCMDLVSFDTPGEYEVFAAIMKEGKKSLVARVFKDEGEVEYIHSVV